MKLLLELALAANIGEVHIASNLKSVHMGELGGEGLIMIV